MRFEVGKSYEATDVIHGKITVIGRTDHFIRVRNKYGDEWRMMIRTDKAGNEFAYDSSVGKKWIESFTYRAERKERK